MTSSQLLSSRGSISIKRLLSLPVENCRLRMHLVTSWQCWGVTQLCPDAKVWRYLVYLEYWILNLMPLMVYP